MSLFVPLLEFNLLKASQPPVEVLRASLGVDWSNARGSDAKCGQKCAPAPHVPTGS